MKTKVTIIGDVNKSPLKKGMTGYIDGYVKTADDIPYAVVVSNEIIDLVPLGQLIVNVDTNVWTCEKCHEVVEGYNVTYSELHEGCGGKCY